jgi:Fe2+ transport system protein FeoA
MSQPEKQPGVATSPAREEGPQDRRPAVVPLDRLSPHQCALVRQVEARDDDMERLMAMGVCAGRTVELVQTGDPLIFKVFGSRIGVSARLASRVLVEPCAASGCPAPDLAPERLAG